MFQEAQDTPLPEDDEDLWNLCYYINLMPSTHNLSKECFTLKIISQNVKFGWIHLLIQFFLVLLN